MVEKIDRLIDICSRYSEEEIRNNYLFSDAIQFEFEKLYEDTTRLSVMFVVDNRDLPMNELRSIRNRVAHDYESVIMKILISTVKNDLPSIKEKLEKYL